MARRPPVQTLVVFDLEATGLPGNSTDYPVRIMEICLEAVQRPAVAAPAAELTAPPAAARGFTTPQLKRVCQRSGDAPVRRRPRPFEPITPPASPPPPLYSPLPAPPRLKNSLLLTVNPGKQLTDVVEELTGLNNELLATSGGFDAQLAEMLRAFVERLPPPVCLVAHNGLKYDFPLLRAELAHVGAVWPEQLGLLCADSLQFFRAEAADQLSSSDCPNEAIYALHDNTLCCSHDDICDACIVCNPSLFVDFDDCGAEVGFEQTRVLNRRAIRCQHTDAASCLVCRHVPLYRRPTLPAARRCLFPDGGGGGGGGAVGGRGSGEPRRRSPPLNLPAVFERRFGMPPERSHCAADDVEALLLLLCSHGDAFWRWADSHSWPLAGVTEMWRRRRADDQRAA